MGAGVTPDKESGHFPAPDFLPPAVPGTNDPRIWRSWWETLVRPAGFLAAGVAPARLHGPDGTRLHEWLKRGYHGTMRYMAQGPDRRHDARYILPGAQSVLLLAAPYDPPPVAIPPRGTSQPCPIPTPPSGTVGIAAYATGEDYHLVLRQRLQQWVIPRLETLFPRERFRTVTDSAPLLERAFAVRAGLGFIGKNTLHIMPGAGSFHFLAAVVTTAHLPRTPLSRTMPDCGQCTRCLDACPTQAFVSPFVLDARRCISYLTIERKQAMTPEEQQPLRGLVFGCDICQQVCPYNKAPAPTLIEEFLEGRTVHREEPASTFPPHLSHRQLRKRFPGSPLLRAGRRLLLHVQGTRQPSKESPPTSG